MSTVADACALFVQRKQFKVDKLVGSYCQNDHYLMKRYVFIWLCTLVLLFDLNNFLLIATSVIHLICALKKRLIAQN